MKYLSLLILTTFLLGCSPGEKENDLDKKNLFGNVKSVKTLHFEATDKFGEIVKGEREYKRYEVSLLNMFNDKGLLIERIDLDSNLQSKSTYLYDDKGNRVESNRYDSAGSLDYKWTYLYDDKGNQVEANRYDSDGIDFKLTYLYDDKGNQVEFNMYDLDGSLDSKSTYLYDDKGNETESKRYFSWNDVSFYLSIISYDYDNQNNWIKRVESSNWIKRVDSSYSADEQGARGFPSHEITEREIEYYVQ